MRKDTSWLHEPFYFAPERKLGGGWLCFKSSPSPPPAPDYAGAARATAAGNREAAIAAQEGSMVNQVTPYGTLNYTQTGTSQNNNPTYTANIDLTPEGQKLLDQQNKLSTGLFNAQDQALGQVNAQGPMDLQSVDDIYNKSYKLNTDRLDPQWDQATKAQETKLANQGIMVGSEAYDNAMRTFNQGKNDAYQQAQQAAIATMPTTYQLASAAYSQPLNQLNALRTGSQVTNPTFVNTPQQGQTAGPNMLGAATAQGQYDQGLYNAQVGQSNSFMSGLGQLGAAALMKYSDRRLKSNIELVGTHPLGIGVYEYDIFGRRERGVMADEVETVRPEAVHLMPNGYKMVDYSVINLDALENVLVGVRGGNDLDSGGQAGLPAFGVC